MGTPSKRNKILHQMKKIMEAVDGIPWHLQFMSDIAEGRSEHINNYVPLITKLNEEYLNLLKEFWSKL